MSQRVLELNALLRSLGCKAFDSFEESRHSVAILRRVNFIKEVGQGLFLSDSSFLRN